VANDFLWRDGGEIVGFLGIYINLPTEAEISGMVHPRRRREGIFTRLLDEALAEVRRRDTQRVLLIVDRSCEAGAGFSIRRGGVVESSEYRMRQSEAPELQGAHEELTIRNGRREEADFVRECIRGAFSLPDEAVAGDDFAERAEETVVIEHAGEPVGVMRVERDEEAADAGIYGFAVVPEQQGRGYGRAALSKVTRDLREDGITSVHLEVLVDNPGALHLYESCGFAVLGIEDYYLISG
jgi:ribosomal protein S18 acetylase RimI-like enzyme